jgi:hypothetical protein
VPAVVVGISVGGLIEIDAPYAVAQRQQSPTIALEKKQKGSYLRSGSELFPYRT